MPALHNFLAESNDIEGLRILLKLGADTNTTDGSGQTPLHIAVKLSGRNPQDRDGILLAVRELILYRADVNRVNKEGQTPLHLAVCCRDYKMVEMLLQHNADINQEDKEGNAALHFATTVLGSTGTVWDLQPGIVKLLLKYNPLLNKQNLLGKTALMLAIFYNNFQIVRELLRNNASILLQDIKGRTAMHCALKLEEVNLDIVRELVSYGGSFNELNYSDQKAITVYVWGLLNAPPSEYEKIESIFKLFLVDGNVFDPLLLINVKDIGMKSNLDLLHFISLCKREVAQMKDDVLSQYHVVSHLLLRGVYYNVSDIDVHTPLEVYDMMVNKLMRGRYPVYCDLIAAGICRTYMTQKCTEYCHAINIGNNDLNFELFLELSAYLSNFDMVKMMMACTRSKWPESWRRYWYSPHFPHYTRCTVL